MAKYKGKRKKSVFKSSVFKDKRLMISLKVVILSTVALNIYLNVVYLDAIQEKMISAQKSFSSEFKKVDSKISDKATSFDLYLRDKLNID